MLPNVLPRSGAEPHVPVLADEVRELLAVQPGETVVDATFGAGGHARVLARDLAGRGKLVAIDRDPDGEAVLRSLQGGCGSRRPLPSRRLLDRALAARSQRRPAPMRCCSISASRRCRSTGRSAGSPTRPTRRSTCAWTRRQSSRRSTSSTNGTRRELATIFRRYGEERYAAAIARCDRPAPFGHAVHAHGRARRHDQVGDPHTGPLRRGPPGQARLPGPPHRRQRRARRARDSAPCCCSRCSGRVGVSP